MEERLPAHRSHLAGAERAGDRQRSEQLVDHGGVVIGLAEEAHAATVAREEERAGRLLAREHLPEVLVGGGRVAHVELHGLTDGDLVAHLVALTDGGTAVAAWVDGGLWTALRPRSAWQRPLLVTRSIRGGADWEGQRLAFLHADDGALLVWATPRGVLDAQRLDEAGTWSPTGLDRVGAGWGVLAARGPWSVLAWSTESFNAPSSAAVGTDAWQVDPAVGLGDGDLAGAAIDDRGHAVLVWQAVTAGGNPDPTAEGISRGAIVLNTGIIVFREGLEAILILTALTASLVRTDKGQWKPVALGAGLSFIASVITWFVVVAIISTIQAPALKVQAATGLLAIVVLLVIMNWFFHNVYWAGWIKLHDRRKRDLTQSTGRSSSAVFRGLVLLGFTAIYREGFEIVLFLQSMRLRGGTPVVLQGVTIGLGLTAMVALLTFVAHRKLPYKRMLVLTGVMLGAVLLVMVGEQVQEMQQAGWCSTTTLTMPIPAWMGMWFAVFPNAEGLAAQFVAGAFVIGSYVLARRACFTKVRPGVASSAAALVAVAIVAVAIVAVAIVARPVVVTPVVTASVISTAVVTLAVTVTPNGAILPGVPPAAVIQLLALPRG